MRRIGLAVLVLGSAMSAANPARSETEFSLQLRWSHQFQFAGYYMALERGYYDDAGLNVELLEGGTNVSEPVTKMLRGDVDFAIGNSGVLIERMNGEPVVALAAIAQTSPIVWIVRADSDIYSPLDLAGKRLMLMPSPESAELLAMLRQEGIKLDELDLVSTTADLDDLIEGRVDAYDGYTTNEPWYLENAGVDYRLLKPRDHGVNFYNDVLVTRESLLEERPAETAAFTEASLKGWRYAIENTEEAIKVIHEKYAPDKSLEHLRFEARELKKLIMPELVTLGHMNPARWEAIGNSYIALDMAEGPVDLDGFLYARPSPADHTWLYRAVAVAAGILVLLSIIVFHFARLNRKLVREATRRLEVEGALREKQAELYRLANTDPLTGTWNRLKFEAAAGQEIRRCRRYGYPLSIIFIDLDHFKHINDVHGHAIGDQVLCEITDLIRGGLREFDFFCRWGGEEFLVLAPHTDLEKARKLAEKLRTAVDTWRSPVEDSLSVSMGVAFLDEDEDLETLIRKADDALYRAKERGRNRVEVVGDYRDAGGAGK